MANVFVKESTMIAIGDAIRGKTGGTSGIYPADMPAEIESICADATVTADEIFAGETAYGADGKITGTFTIDDELEEQGDLISQIATLLEEKALGSSGEDVTAETNAYTEKIASLESAVSALETELAGKASGGSGNTVKTCTVTFITEDFISGEARLITYYENTFSTLDIGITDGDEYSDVVANSIIETTGARILSVESLDGTSAIYPGSVVFIGNSDTTITTAIL